MNTRQMYNKKTYVRVELNFHKIKDKAVLDRLFVELSKTDYVRNLILKDIGEHNGKK